METVLGFIRHALTFGGGYLVAKGHIDAVGMEQAVAAIVTLIGIVWSAASKSDKFPAIK